MTATINNKAGERKHINHMCTYMILCLNFVRLNCVWSSGFAFIMELRFIVPRTSCLHSPEQSNENMNHNNMRRSGQRDDAVILWYLGALNLTIPIFTIEVIPCWPTGEVLSGHLLTSISGGWCHLSLLSNMYSELSLLTTRRSYLDIHGCIYWCTKLCITYMSHICIIQIKNGGHFVSASSC